MTHKILVATRSFGSTSSKPWDVLKDAGIDWIKADMDQKMTEDRMISLLQDVDGCIIGVVPMTARVLENAPRLKVICFHGVGVDFIDRSTAAHLGIIIANCPGANNESVADLAIGLMLAAARNVVAADRSLRQGRWESFGGVDLWKKTLGLIGYGHIGRSVARRALGFDMNVLVFDPFIPSDSIEPYVRFVSLDELLAESDFVSIHAALTPGNQNMIGTAQFARMNRSAYLINTARGGLVDENCLYQAHKEGQIAGAGLDAFVAEPLGNSPLFELSNVVFTPHLGAHTRESVERVGIMAAQNVVQVLQGGTPLHQVRFDPSTEVKR